jgi:3-oxoacyl-[acyl-carrier protein] reductase
MGLLQNKTAVITGARTGIGKETVRVFAENGADVIACMRTKDNEFDTFATEIMQQYGVKIECCYFDISDEEDIKRASKEILGKKIPIDILVNSAGVVGSQNLFHMTKMEEIKTVYNTNFFGLLCFTQYITRQMIRQKYGNVINIASMSGYYPWSPIAYSSSKAALINATEKLAIELIPFNIRVNAVAPSLTDTKMVGHISDALEEDYIENNIIKRKATPLEVANTILFLASDLSTYTTGETLKVRGGGR